MTFHKPRFRRLSLLFLCALLLLTGGCATVFHDTRQKIEVFTDPPGATATRGRPAGHDSRRPAPSEKGEVHGDPDREGRLRASQRHSPAEGLRTGLAELRRDRRGSKPRRVYWREHFGRHGKG